MNGKKLGIIGLGRMGRCLVGGLLESKAFQKSDILFTTRHTETTEAVKRDLGLRAMKNNSEVVSEADIVVLAVKPQNTREVLKEISKSIKPTTILISIVASISTDDISESLGKDIPVLRAMPNTPSFVRCGITAVCLGKHAKESHWEIAETIFKPLGTWVKADEKNMDAVTGLSGCGPAYVYVILESLTEAGIKVGLPRDLATQLAAHTVLGSAKMLLETGRHPASLKDEVTTPAGCTIDGLLELEEGKLRVTLMKAVVQATKRARILAKNSKKNR
jgi:pyrroline-5-carboxylate reductase